VSALHIPSTAGLVEPIKMTSMNEALRISEEDINQIKIDALRGSVKAADRLEKHYAFVMLDNRDALYWSQIQAENGGPDDQYSYGFELSTDDKSTFGQIRARYWLTRAKEGGNSYADDVLKEMEQDE
jgi:hypothetical protein